MTHITNIMTKKALKQRIQIEKKAVYLNDPSIFNPISGFVRDILEHRKSITVTNHPKRSYFAIISRNKKGEITVK